MSLEALVERAHAQLAGSRSQRLMLWRTTLPTAVTSPGNVTRYRALYATQIMCTMSDYMRE